MKKTILLMIFLSLNAIVTAQAIAEIPTITTMPPSNVLVPLKVTNFTNIGSITLRIQYDPTKIVWIGMENLNTQITGVVIGVSNGVISVAWASTISANITTGKLFDMKFDYLQGESQLVFLVTQCEVTDPLGTPINVTYIDGRVNPVELTSFTANAVNGKVLLNWATATEMNNKGFEVERRASDAAWQNIGYVQGSGTTTEPRLYSFTDATLTKDGNYEYRLKQVDHNGDFEYSKVISVNVTVTPENFALYQNYPNPFNPSTQISYSLPTGSYVKLVLYDAIGNVAGYIYEGYKEAGHHSINYDASHLTNGVYYYQITAGEFRAVKKLILMK